METNAVEDRRGAFGAVPRLLTQKGGNRTDHLGVCPKFLWGLLKLPVGEHVLRVESLYLFWRAPYQGIGRAIRLVCLPGQADLQAVVSKPTAGKPAFPNKFKPRRKGNPCG